jgi:hypothetical protein
VLLAVAVAAVVAVPALRVDWFGAAREHDLAFASAAAVIWACSVGYLYLVWRNNSLPRGWIVMTAAYNLMIVLIKFVFSPSVFSRSGTSLGQFVGIGLGVGLLYFAGLGVVALGVRFSSRQGTVPWQWKIGMVAAVGMIATVVRSLIGSLATPATSKYLSALFSARGGILLVALLLTSTLAVQAFEYGSREALDGSGRNGNAVTLWTASLLLFTYHALWVIFMVRLFA